MAEMPEQKFGPAEVYIALSQNQPMSFLLESAEDAGKMARYSYIGTDPLITLMVKNGGLTIGGEGRPTGVAKNNVGKVGPDADTTEIVRKTFLLDQITIPKARYPRFICGPVGYFAYDIIRRLTDIGARATDDLQHPDAEFMLAKNMLVFDHVEKKTYICSNAFVSEGCNPEDVYANALKEIEGKTKQLEKVNPSPSLQMDAELTASVRSNMTRNEFIAAVKQIQKYIDSGDVLQLVLSRRVETDLKCDPYLVYLALRKINPSPYMYFLNFGSRKIIGSSPETLVRVENREVMTRPIGGTRRRGKNRKEDKEIERKLLSNRKEREEHRMLVHLGREDISKVAKAGSVKVEDFMTIDKYSHVMHIVSTVKGTLRDDKDEFDALKANFPAGTVVGAPRLRAMEIIEELEPTRRGIYAGGIGYFDYRHNMDFAIAIRTIVVEKGKAYAQVGAGIVSRSVPELEFYETENKGRALLKAIGIAEASGGG
jgi:anthranilate synthase component 1